MNAFSKNYTPSIDWTPVSAAAERSRTRSAQREAALNSDDMHTRIAASGNAGPLSNNSKNYALLKNSKMG